MVRKKTFMTNGNMTAATQEEKRFYDGTGDDGQRPERKLSRWKIARTLLTLIPRQFTDEMELAKKEIQHRGKILAYAVLFFVAAASAALLLITALTIAMIAVIAIALPLWLAALIVSIALIVIIAACLFFGVKTVKKALPLTPELSLRGIALDRGALKEGDEFRAEAYDQKQENKRISKKQKKHALKEEQKNSKCHSPSENGNRAATSYGDLITRLNVRRDRMSYLRSQLKGKTSRQKPGRRSVAQAGAGQARYDRIQKEPDICQNDPQAWQQEGHSVNGKETGRSRQKPLADHFTVFTRHLKGNGSQAGKTKLSFMALIASGLVSMLFLSPIKKKKSYRHATKNSPKDFGRK